tara:strand:+ start:1417 stop:1806 length:390 start_codon:yes stop_codon:yes gene_type:complete
MLDNLLEVRLREKEDFLKIVETLTRIGISTRDKRLVQTCHLFHKRGKYYICHFKELFKLDGVDKTEITDDDLQRRNAIAKLLEEWDLCNIVYKDKAEPSSLNRIKIVPYSRKNEYLLKQNYTIGKKSSV